jgi:uncharacterized protein YceH (UPF0502 family)
MPENESVQQVTAKESEDLLRIVNGLKIEQIVERLEELAEREKGLLASELGKDPELREITLWNLAVLCAAAEHLNKSI